MCFVPSLQISQHLYLDQVSNVSTHYTLRIIFMNYPFSALVGQDTMRLALLLNAINPSIGGVLIRGEKGTAKSTAVRALAAVLPEIEVAAPGRYPFSPADLPNDAAPHKSEATEFQQVPLVNLPLGVTEDRLLGTINLEAALQEGRKTFEPGLLAQVHQGVLYIDEVNLLNDHVVDVLLDVVAMGVNRVEREGVSASHPARFILIGTMNPEEGDLRPQLLDRFGLSVEVAGSRDKAIRTEIVRRRLEFEADKVFFQSKYAVQETALKMQITAARALLPQVTLPDALLEMISEIAIAYDVDGMRADLVIHKTATTLAAWEGMRTVTPDHIRKAAELALPHRQRRQPLDDSGLDPQQLDDITDRYENEQPREPESAPTEGD